MLKSVVFILACLAINAPAHAEQPPCLPAVLALSTSPVGVPVEKNTYAPTLLNAPVRDGVAAFWYCKVKGDIRVVEVHGTPEAIARSGGLRALQSLYMSGRDDAWARLEDTGKNCVDPRPDVHALTTRSDCYPFVLADGKTVRYVCVNPALTDADEGRLCNQLVRQIAQEWPR